MASPLPAPVASGGASQYRKYLVPGAIAAGLILAVVVVVSLTSGGGGGARGSDSMLLAEPQSDGTNDLYLVQFGEEAGREGRVADGVVPSVVGPLVDDFRSNRIGGFGGFLESGTVLLGYQADDRSRVVSGRFPLADGGVELIDSNDRLSVFYTESQLFVQEFSGESTRCYLGSFAGPIERTAKGDTCYAAGINEGRVLVVESEIDGDEESITVFDGAEDLYSFERAARAGEITTTGLGGLLLVPDFDSVARTIRVFDARTGEELYETDEGATVDVVDVGTSSDRALAVVDDGDGELTLLVLDRSGVFEVARSEVIQAAISADGRWVIFQAPEDPTDREATLWSLDVDSSDSPEPIELFSADGRLRFDVRGEGAVPRVIAVAIDDRTTSNLSDLEIFAGLASGPIQSLAVFDDVSDGGFVVAADERLLLWLISDEQLVVGEIDSTRGVAVETELEWDRVALSAVNRSGRVLMIGTDRDENVLAVWSPDTGLVTELAVEDFILWAGFGPQDQVLYVTGDSFDFGDSELRSVATDGTEEVLYRDVNPVAFGWEGVPMTTLADPSVIEAYVDPVAAACRADGVELAVGPVTRLVQATQVGAWEICIELDEGIYQVLATSYNTTDLFLFGEGPTFDSVYDDDSGEGSNPFFGPTFFVAGVWRFSVDNYFNTGSLWTADFEFRLERG